MPNAAWTQPESVLLRTLVQEGKNDAEIAEIFQQEGIRRTYKSIQRKRQREGWHAMVAASPTLQYDDFFRLTGNALCLFDIQSPYHDAAWINRCTGLALRWKIRQAILGGDIANFSGFSFFGGDPNVSMSTEVKSTEQILGTLSTDFEDVWWFAGNHEARISNALGGLMALTKLLRVFETAPNVHLSDYRYCELVSNGVEFYIEHPGNHSKNVLTVGVELASIHNKSTICGHGHLWGQTRDKSNRHWVIDAGMCADPLRLEYAQKVHKRYPKQMQGAAIVRDGIPVLLSPDNISLYEGIG